MSSRSSPNCHNLDLTVFILFITSSIPCSRVLKFISSERFPFLFIFYYIYLLFAVNLLARTIQGTYISEGGGFDHDQSWLCTMCALPSLTKRHVAIARLKHAANMGRNSHEIRFFIMVLTPSKEVS